MRKFIIALIGAAIIAVLAMPTMATDASARGWGGHHHGGGGWHGGGGFRGGWGYRGYGGWGGYYGYPYAYYPYGGYGCYRSVRVGTPYGWAWRRVWVCG